MSDWVDTTGKNQDNSDTFQNCGDAVALAVNSSLGRDILPRGGLDSDSIIQAANSLGTPIYRGGTVSAQDLHGLGPGTVIRYDRIPGSSDYKYGKDHAEITAINPTTGKLGIASYSSPDKPMLWKSLDDNYMAKLPKNAVITNLLPQQQQAMNVMNQRMNELQSPNQYASLIDAAAKHYGIPQMIPVIQQMLQVESGGNPNAVSPKGAGGLMQLMPDTAKGLGVTDVNDPRQNIFGGVRYFADMLKKYGNVPMALAAYNAGPGNVDKYGGIPPFAETQAYVNRIMGKSNQPEMMAADVSGKATPSASDWVDTTNQNEWVDSQQAQAQPQEQPQEPSVLDKVLSYVPSLSAPEQWNWKPAMQYGGMGIGGAIGGIVGGPAGAAAGGTLGYGIGNELHDLIRGTHESLNTPMETAKYTGNVLKEGAENALAAESVVPALMKVGQIGGALLKPTLGRLSGTGTKAIEQSLKGSEDFVKAYKGELSGEDIVNNARDALGILKQNRSTDYVSKFKDIMGIPQQLDITPVRQKLVDLMKSFRVKSFPNGEFDFSTMAINDSGRKEIKNLINTIDEWNDFTPEGVDALKRYVGDFYSESSQARAFVKGLEDSIKKVLTKNIPGYYDMTKTYAEQSKLIFDIQKSLSLKTAELGGQATADQTLRRLMSSMKDNFKLRGLMLDSLSSESGIDLSGQVAGHAMNSFMPYGLGGSAPAIGLEIASTMWNPKLAAIWLSSSPKVQGMFLRYWGKALSEMQSISLAAQKSLGYAGAGLEKSIEKSFTNKKEKMPLLEPSLQY